MDGTIIKPAKQMPLLERFPRIKIFWLRVFGGTMPFHLGPTELIIILVIVIVLFGAGRIGRLGGDFGKAISEFRKAVKPGDEDKKDQA